MSTNLNPILTRFSQPIFSLDLRNEPMFAEPARIAVALIALTFFALPPDVVVRGQEAPLPQAASPAGLDPPVTTIDPAAAPPRVPPLDSPPATVPAAPIDPAAASPSRIVPGTLSPPTINPAEAPPIARKRPKIEPMGAPSHFKVELHPAFEGGSVKATLEAEGFDIRGSVDSEGWSRWYVTAPSEADLEQSERRLREALGPEAKITAYLRNLPRELVERMLTSPTRQWFFKWNSSDAPGRWDEEQLRVANALADSTLDIGKITYSEHGTSYITIQSPPAEIPKIEEFVRTLVKEPRFWRPVRLEEYYAQHASSDPSEEAVEAPATPPVASQSSPFAAQVLLIETDWTKANDRDAASRLSHSLSNGIFEDKRAGKEVFPPGYAATFAGDEARRVSDDLQRLGLVRQSMPLSQVDLELSEKGVEALGAATVSFQERAANGQGETVVWNVLLVTEPSPALPPGGDPFSQPDPATAPPASPPAGYRVAVVSWKDRTAAKSQSQEEVVEADVVPPAADVAPEEGERYVGSFVISRDQSAIVPLALPGLEGAMIVVAPTQKGPAVRSLGPRGGVLQRWGLTAEFSVDWDDLIRAYEASSLGVAGTKARLIEATEKTADANGGEETADVTFTWRPAQEGQVEQLQTALKERFPQTQFVLGQFQGEQGASLVVRTPARFAEAVAEAIEGVAAQILPGIQSMNSTIAMVPPEREQEEPDTLVVRWGPATSDQTSKVREAIRDFGGREFAATQFSRDDSATMAFEVPSGTSQEALAKVRSELPGTNVLSSIEGVQPTESSGMEDYTLGFTNLSEDDLKRVVDLLSSSDLPIEVLATSKEDGDRSATLEIRTTEAASLAIHGLVKKNFQPSAVPWIYPNEQAPWRTDDESKPRRTFVFEWSPATEEQLAKVEEAIRTYRAGDIVFAQRSGDMATVHVDAINTSGSWLRKLVFDAIPGVNVKATFLQRAAAPAADPPQTLLFRLEYAASDEVAKLLNSLKLDPAIRVVSDARTNSIVLSAPEATKYRHVQAAIDLLKELDRPAEAAPVAEKNAKTAPDRAANAAKLRSQLARVEADVQQTAEAARSASGPERTTKSEDLRRVVASAFDLRLKLQREEAAELRDRLKKVEENLARRERIQNAVIERRVEVLLDPALEWPEVKSEESSLPSAEVASLPADDSAQRTGDGGTGSPWKATDVQGRGDAFAAATSLAREIADLTDQAEAIERDGTPDGSEVRLALIRRQLDLLRQEFDARQQALKLELESLKAKLSGAQASFERVQTLVDTGAVPQGELAKVEAELKAAQSDVARQEVLLQQYERARASLPAEGETGSLDPSQPQSSGAAIHPASRSATDASSFGTVKPSPFDKVPAEMLGTWRLTRRVAADGSESKTSPTTWTFDEETLLVRDSGADDVRYWLELASATPRAFRTLRIVFAENGVGYGLRCKYEIEGDSLRVVGYPDADGNLIPEKVAAAPNVDYYEFERVRDAASTSSATDDAKSAR